MPPKFQSSFIPKGPAASSASGMPSTRSRGDRSLLSAISYFIFTASVLLALGVFGYKIYLEYRIGQMSADLSRAQSALDPAAIEELTSLDSRILATKTLVSRHELITPLLDFLEASTLKSVRFTSLDYSAEESVPKLALAGEARGYSALALQAQIFNDSRYFKDPVFSDLNLNDKGEVEFSFKAEVNRELLDYTVSPLQAATSPQL